MSPEEVNNLRVIRFSLTMFMLVLAGVMLFAYGLEAVILMALFGGAAIYWLISDAQIKDETEV